MRFASIAAVMALASSTLAISASRVQANINRIGRLAIQANNDASELGGLRVSMQLPVCLEKPYPLLSITHLGGETVGKSS